VSAVETTIDDDDDGYLGMKENCLVAQASLKTFTDAMMCVNQRWPKPV